VFRRTSQWQVRQLRTLAKTLYLYSQLALGALCPCPRASNRTMGGMRWSVITDCVHHGHSGLPAVQLLNGLGIPMKLVRIIKMCLGNTYCNVHIGEHLMNFLFRVV
jgi:hypothetical protein